MAINKKLFLLLGIFFIFSIIFFKITAPDFWWHADYGRYFLQKGFPTQDPFTFVPSPKPYFQTFVSDIVLYLSYKLLNIYGIYLLKFLLLLGIFFIFKAMGIDIITMGLIFISISMRAFARPEIFSFLFFTLFIFIYWKKPKNRWFFVFILTLLWNQHHSAVLTALLFPLAFFIDDLFSKKFSKSYIWDFFLIILAFLINPSGLRNFVSYFNAFLKRSFSAQIAEWQPFFSSQYNVSLFYKLLFIFFIILFFYLLLKYILQRKKEPFLYIAFGFLILTLLSRRFFPYFAISFIIPLSTFIKRLRYYPQLVSIVLLLIIFTINIFYPTMRMPLERGIGINSHFDFKITKLFKEFNIRNNIFNDYDIGGFLSYELKRKVFIYGINLNKNKLKDYIRFVQGKNIPYIIKKYNISTIILKPLYLYQGGKKIRTYLNNNNWKYLGYNMRYDIWIK